MGDLNLKQQQEKLSVLDPGISGEVDEFDEDMHNMNKKYDELKQFYHDFSFKTIIFDPLDREIMYEEEEEDDEGESVTKIVNQATKRDDFLEKL